VYFQLIDWKWPPTASRKSSKSPFLHVNHFHPYRDGLALDKVGPPGEGLEMTTPMSCVWRIPE
jgi:hypothetical protein